jgi:hypothetical protein
LKSNNLLNLFGLEDPDHAVLVLEFEDNDRVYHISLAKMPMKWNHINFDKKMG